MPTAQRGMIHLASGGWDHAVKIWQIDAGGTETTACNIESLPVSHRSVVQGLAWSHGQDALLSTGADGRVGVIKLCCS